MKKTALRIQRIQYVNNEENNEEEETTDPMKDAEDVLGDLL